jgi:hypothetical protein
MRRSGRTGSIVSYELYTVHQASGRPAPLQAKESECSLLGWNRPCSPVPYETIPPFENCGGTDRSSYPWLVRLLDNGGQR